MVGGAEMLFVNLFIMGLVALVSLVPLIAFILIGLRFVRAQEAMASALRDLANNPPR
jgi:hypothetical protein